MYPMPVARWRPGSRLLYKLSLPCALLLWLLPLLAVLVTSWLGSRQSGDTVGKEGDR